MMLGTPRSEQGQMVEYSYGWHEGFLYRRTLDKSDRSVAWHVADRLSCERLADTGYDAGGENFPPNVTEWMPTGDPTDG